MILTPMAPRSFSLVRGLRALLLGALLGATGLRAAEVDEQSASAPGNDPERVEWFRDLGFGLFIHWSLDSQLGSVINQSMIGASEDYLRRYIEDLPQTFDPDSFQPEEWAALAKLAGVRYVVFTAKHHSGFCMFETATTDFSIMNTPFRRDVTEEILMRFRAEGVVPGLYFSPDDFWWLHTHGIALQRHVPEVIPQDNPGLMEHDKAQLRELLNNYGPIDILFFDGESDGLRELAWEIDPYTVITRGAMQTPEQYVPGVPLEGAWEAHLTMGTQWQYKPTNETYKSGGELIATLVETRAKGGNLLLNVGPKPNGELPIDQEERLREIALWMFINQECIYSVRPWIITNEANIWFTKARDANTVYAIVKQEPVWPHGTWREIVLRSLRSTAETTASVLGQNDAVLAYQPDVVPQTTFEQQADGLHIRAMRAQRIYNNRQWPNPVVIKLTNVQPALVPPRIDTTAARWDEAAGHAVVEGEITRWGDADELEAGFEYRDITGLDAKDRDGATWQQAEFLIVTAPGEFSQRLITLRAGGKYEVRAVVRHPLLRLHGRELRLSVP